MDHTSTIRLTSLAHGGGCGCKLSPGVLREMLAGVPAFGAFPHLLVGPETSDDAAVWRLNDSQALVATVDFFNPIVDDPFEFGRIAAANALSDVYAMGGQPIMALALVGLPLGKLPVETMQRIMAGGAAICAEAGVPIAGGHSIDSPEPLYGLVGLGLVHPDAVRRNSAARDGDVLILGKPLGVGVYSAALKQEQLPDAGYRAMIASCTQLNAVGPALAKMASVHAMTDVTGFGLLGHALELCRGAKVGARIRTGDLPFLPGVRDLARQGFVTGASKRNWASYGESVRITTPDAEAWQDLLCDPQTNGGLLVAVAPEGAEAVLATMRSNGFANCAIVGAIEAGDATITVA